MDHDGGLGVDSRAAEQRALLVSTHVLLPYRSRKQAEKKETMSYSDQQVYRCFTAVFQSARQVSHLPNNARSREDKTQLETSNASEALSLPHKRE